MTPPASNVAQKTDETIEVSTGALSGSRKQYVAGSERLMGVQVAQREIVLSERSGEKPLAVYDTSGPYTDRNHTVNINDGLSKLRQQWIDARDDAERYVGRPMRPEDNGYKEYQKIEVHQFPHPIKTPLRVKPLRSHSLARPRWTVFHPMFHLSRAHAAPSFSDPSHQSHERSINPFN